MFLPHSKQEYRPPPSRCIIDSTTAFKSKIGRVISKTQIPMLSLRFRNSTTVHFKTILAGTSWKKDFLDALASLELDITVTHRQFFKIADYEISRL